MHKIRSLNRIFGLKLAFHTLGISCPAGNSLSPITGLLQNLNTGHVHRRRKKPLHPNRRNSSHRILRHLPHIRIHYQPTHTGKLKKTTNKKPKLTQRSISDVGFKQLMNLQNRRICPKSPRIKVRWNRQVTIFAKHPNKTQNRHRRRWRPSFPLNLSTT